MDLSVPIEKLPYDKGPFRFELTVINKKSGEEHVVCDDYLAIKIYAIKDGLIKFEFLNFVNDIPLPDGEYITKLFRMVFPVDIRYEYSGYQFGVQRQL